MSSAETGIAFTNTLHSGPQLNILYYLYYYNGGGVATGDINNDGLTDVYFTANHKAGNKLYLNKGNWVFEDITDQAGVAGTADWCTGVTMADVNGDGLLDIFTCAVANQFGLSGTNSLYVNQGNGRFEDKTAEFGLNFSGLSTQAAFFDFDHDGDLDMYLLNHSKKPHANVVDTANRRKFDSIAGDRLYRQDRNGSEIRFKEIGAEAGIFQSNLGYGLGLAVADFNNDGWEDIYVGNDFHENDYYYINQQNGTFKEEGSQHFGHYSRFSMGNDAADYNNDGQIDVLTVDMLPPDEKTMKTYGSDENPNVYKVKLGINGYQDQFSRNCLQQNLGSGIGFSDVALMAGVQATDWSWCPLFADFDNDGRKDLFISSGIVKRPVDLDYVQFVSAMQKQKNLDNTTAYDAETIARMPDGARHPFFFKGKDDHAFEPVSEAWGTATLNGYYNGSAYADLDNDGDLDMVVNCIDAPALLLRNNHKPGNWLRIGFADTGANRFGMGAKAYLFTQKGIQYQQLMATRGFQSASEPVLHFGLGDSATVDSLLLIWPDQSCQTIKNPGLSQRLVGKRENATVRFDHSVWFSTKDDSLTDDITVQSRLQWAHAENDFVDFNRQYLLPHVQSTRGPKVAVADVNGDGLHDFYVCGAHHQSGALWLQQLDGTFKQGIGSAFAASAAAEEVDAQFADVDGDGDSDLLVVSGGYELDDGAPLLHDHLYLNDGMGLFAEKANAIPALSANKSCLAAADVDGDRDIDLFIGRLSHAGGYGIYADSYLLVNDGKGNFKLSSGLPASSKHPSGMITTAAFADMDADGRQDLVVAGEWMPLTIYYNKPDGWVSFVVPGSSGMWQHLLVADCNGDGKPDVLAGNWGLNSKLASGKDGPLKMYVKDFDQNGREEQIVAYTVKGKQYTFLAKDELERALPVLKKAYLTYGEVAGKTVQYMFYDLFKDYREWTAETLASAVFIQNGKGGFDMQALPSSCQRAPVMSITALHGGKAWMLGGNFYGTVPYEGKYDALRPVILQWNTHGPVATAAWSGVGGEVRDLAPLMVGRKPAVLVAVNNKPLRLLSIKPEH